MAGSILQVQGGLRAARVLVGLPGHRPSAFNIKVGKCMKASGAKPTNGGRYDRGFQQKFVDCCRQSGAKIGAGR